jgi:hypothetical protein
MVSRDVSRLWGDLMGTSRGLVVLADSGPFCAFIAHVLVSRDVSEAQGDLMGPSPRVAVLANWGPFCELLLMFWVPETSPDHGVILWERPQDSLFCPILAFLWVYCPGFGVPGRLRSTG